MRITPSGEERSAGAFSSATIEKASHHMRSDGTLIVEDIINPALIVNAREAFLERYDRYLHGLAHDDALEVGERRLMITVDLDPPFDRRELFANSWLFSLLSAVFEGDFILDAYGVVCSLPGAPEQHVHQDGGDIFAQAGLDRLLPIIAVTVGIPLLEMNGFHGTTKVWPGSHRDETRALTEMGEEPRIREGSCVLWDYRLRHAGTANQSTAFRPLLYMTYCRSWFMDHKNYTKQVALRAPKAFLAKLPEDLRQLLARAREC